MPVNTRFVIYLVGLFLCFAANSAIFDLSSSFNIEDGVGTASLAICYGVSLLAALPLPAIGLKIGCKRLLIIGELCYFVFLLGNLYSGFATLAPAGVFLGIGEAFVWTMMPIISTYFAEQELNEDETLEPKIRLYTGYYHAAIELSTVAGNAVSSVVLHIDRQHSPLPHYTNVKSVRDLSVCGANDCQIPNITRANVDQYHPLNPVTRYVFIAIIAAMNLASVLLFHFFIPDKIPWELEEDEEGDQNHKDLSLLGDADEDQASAESTAKTVAGNVTSGKDNKPNPKQSLLSFLNQSVKDTFRLAISGKSLLIATLTVYNGAAMGFRLTEMTRSLSSCIMGVDKVGLCVIVHGVSSTCFAYVAGKFAKRFGRNIPFVVAGMLDVAINSFLLAWEITESNAWLTYVVFFAAGMPLSTFSTLVTAMYGEYFPEERKLAFNLWNIVVSIGLMWQFAVSTYLCVYVKIYIQFALLGCGLATYFVSQALYYPDEFWLTRRGKAVQADCPPTDKEELDATAI